MKKVILTILCMITALCTTIGLIGCGGTTATAGLVFSLSANGNEYSVTGYTGSSTNVVIPSVYNGKPVTSIGDGAFFGCNTLTSITIGNSVISIGDSAFFACTSLTSVIIPDSVTSIGDSAFSTTSPLTYNIKDGIKYLGNSTNRYLYLAGVEDKSIISATLDNNCKFIVGYAFSSCYSLASIEIPNSVISIGNYAFYGCNLLTYNVKDGLKYLGNSTNPYLYLAGVVDNSITTTSIDDNCRFIGNFAISGCSALTSVEIPNSVTSILEGALYFCESLHTIKFTGTVNEWNAISKSYYWASSIKATSVICTDGEVAI